MCVYIKKNDKVTIMKQIGFTILLMATLSTQAQHERWQQKVHYTMDIVVDAANNQFSGKQKIMYWNNSPDTLKTLFFHLPWNAFQPGSMMDQRSQQLGKKNVMGRPDWDQRVRDRIAKLKSDELGYQRVNQLKVNGVVQSVTMYETVLKVELNKFIAPKSKTLIELDFSAQVPIQIRRSGRDNAEGVRFSMAQWYPKLSEYDQEGWHPTPYVAREFYGVWGDFDVNITIDSRYVIAATGYLQNGHEIGHGYEKHSSLPYVKTKGDKLTWKFKAPNVHDFVWAADPNYTHNSKQVRKDLILHSFYKIDTAALTKSFNEMSPRMKQNTTLNNFIAKQKMEWDSVLELAARALPYMEKSYGQYPYKQYSFIQGGDGGMEYPMATLLKNAGTGVVIHEWMHSWYQMMLGTNESLYAWMDEGFTSFAEANVQNFLSGFKSQYPHQDAYDSYLFLANSEFNEPLTTHADHYSTNTAYSINSYSKGEVFLEQLGYIVGASVRDSILLNYYRKWRFKHPALNDFMRVAEQTSGLQLDWYKDFFVMTSKTIDYGIDSLWEENGKTNIRLKNFGTMPMPIDLELTFKDGSKEIAYAPQYLMFGVKPQEDKNIKRTIGEPWKWTHPVYTVSIDRKLTELKKAEIDPLHRMADKNLSNNKLELNW